ncbi:M16 family metallopeptidase [Pedomonas sp. V897]|uniref:M16 family metallopeptidase n=1 Tax=Pedomonas sp. V897 TaxID=3446482 RepID=UPI003EE20F6B
MTLQISRLANGLRIASLDMPGLETAAVGLYVDTGSRFEPAPAHGVAHMLEHMVFKGTRRRSARQIAEEIEAVGGLLNAYTGRDQTTFYARVLADDIPLGLDLISDLITEPALDAEEMNREREVILQELCQARDTPDDIIFDDLQETAFAGQPLGRSILGTEETIQSLQPVDVRDWLDGHYRAESMVLAVAGKVDHAAIVRLAEERLGSLTAGRRPDCAAARYTGGETRSAKPIEQTHVALALKGVSYSDPDYYPLLIYATALGGGMSSRLFQAVREERGLAYSIYSYATNYAETGLFTLYLATGPDSAGEAVSLTLDTLLGSLDGMSAEELHRARAQLKASVFMGLESCSGLSEQIGRQLLLFGRVISTAEIIERIEAATAEDIRAAAVRMVQSGPLTLATVGPSSRVPGVDTLQARLS